MAPDSVPWSAAWSNAAPGFYGAGHGRAEDHFATAVMDGPRVAASILSLAMPALDRLGDRRLTVTDVGAAAGTLLDHLRRAWPTEWLARTDWRAIDLRPRPDDLEPPITWVHGDLRDVASTLVPGPGLVIAHEFLDDIPCDVLEIDDDRERRLVLVDPDAGGEELGPRLSDRRACQGLGVDPDPLDRWCDAWWPRREPAARVEVGLSRDLAWAAVAGLVTDGVAVAADYGHLRADRDRGVWDGGTLVGYRNGRVVAPIPNGTCNITAHVAIDAAAGHVAGSRIIEPPGPVGASTPTGLHWLVRGTMAP